MTNEDITLIFKISGRRAKLLIAAAWGLSFMFAVPTLFLFHEKLFLNEKTGGEEN